ncbi:MAG TPA: type II toxin-antitoxin system PemK/MazF family toxin [Solirubrobacterales bacterium]
MIREPERGEIYFASLGQGVGSEQRGRRPLLVLSIEQMNRAPAELIVAVPLTTTYRGIRLHVRIEPEESGLPRVSYAMPEMIRNISMERLGPRIGRARIETVEAAARNAGVLIGLGQTKF